MVCVCVFSLICSGISIFKRGISDIDDIATDVVNAMLIT